ncbi:UNVERIFIED_CONTAM: protein EMBRYO defective [Sesamum latifolium]|uniref:Protein EMBRYO defective n=1 Tax=Sesamum latifolium TaxID=2727402 RepID=A0AAW2V003_9LAMI
MADEAASEVPMEVAEVTDDLKPEEDSENVGSKRAREEGEEPELNGEKRAKTEDEKSVEEVRLESSGDGEGEAEEEKKGEKEGEEAGGATIGPKTFGSSVEMFDYFYKLLHAWPANLSLNKYEHIVLLELLKKGHLEAERKIGKGVKAFQVRFHPQFKSRCFFLIREDESVDDFSFRKCVDHILPLPENMQVKHDVNKALRGKGGGRGRGRGRGRGGK